MLGLRLVRIGFAQCKLPNCSDEKVKQGNAQCAPQGHDPPVGTPHVLHLEADGHGFAFLGLQWLAEGEEQALARQVDIERRHLAGCDPLLYAINFIDLPLLPLKRFRINRQQRGSPGWPARLALTGGCPRILATPLLGLEEVAEGKILLGILFLLNLPITPA